MTKRLVIGVILLFITTTVSVVGLSATKTICEIITQDVAIIENHIFDDENDLATLKAKQLTQNWDNQYKILCSYIEHDELERCEISINAVYTYLKLGDTASALILCEDIKTSAKHIFTNESPGFWNIF